MRISDWSSDVCSSDLRYALPALRSLIRIYESEHDWPRAIEAVKTLHVLVDEPVPQIVHYYCEQAQSALAAKPFNADAAHAALRSEERRVGKACVRTWRSRWAPYH